MPSKIELLAIIDKQKETLNKYEARLIDLVRSYKSLQKEKSALQESLAAVIGEETDSQPSKKDTEKVDDVAEPSDSKSPQSVVDSEASEVVNLMNKVKTLQNSLKVLSVERVKNETLLKEDRKELLAEKKKLETQLECEIGENRLANIQLKSKLDETMSKLALTQVDREKETNNIMTMIRELEAKLSKERHDKEKIESMLYSSKEKQKSLTVAAKSNEVNQRTITDLQNELEQVRRQLKKAVQQCQQPPLLKELQTSMKDIQLQYRQAILQEQIRAEAAERNARELSEVHEERVTSLERKLTDLSTNAAKYNRTNQSQQDSIIILKERVHELSHENSKLCSREPFPVKHESKPLPEADLTALTKLLTTTWERICDFCEKTKNYVDIEDLLLGSDVIHSRCQRDYLKLKEEITSVRDIKSSSTCSCGLQEQTNELVDRVRGLTNDSNLTQKTHAEQVTSLTKEAAVIRRLHEAQLLEFQQKHVVTVSNLEQQLSDHCQRSLTTLREREEEISRLSQELHRMHKDAEEHPRSVAAALLAQVETTGGMEGPLLHHLEEMARKELEVVELRKHKRQLERAMRDLQAASIERQEFLQDSVFRLEGEVNRLKRNVSREGENLEYLKNVILKYMTSSSQSRYFMLNAISTVLKFSPEEVESVRLYLSYL